MKFYKILNEYERHGGLSYKTGLNVDTSPFKPSGDCEPGGIYFAREFIFEFIGYGPYIREVVLPEEARLYKNPGTPVKWKADRVILGERRLWVDVIEELLDEGAYPSGDLLRWAARVGDAKIMQRCIELGGWGKDVLALAAAGGYTNCVKLLIEAGFREREDDCNYC